MCLKPPRFHKAMAPLDALMMLSQTKDSLNSGHSDVYMNVFINM